MLSCITVLLCFLIFDINLLIVKFIIYTILACNFYIDNYIVFQLFFRNKKKKLNVKKMLKC